MYAPPAPSPAPAAYLPPPPGAPAAMHRVNPPPNPPSAPASAPARQQVVVPPRVLALAAAALTFCVSTALPWYAFKAENNSAPMDWSGWTRAMFSPVVPLAAIAMAAVAVISMLAVFGQRPLPQRVLGFEWNQVRILVGAYATIVVGAILVMARDWTTPSVGLGNGYWLALVAVAAYDITLALEGRVAPFQIRPQQ